MSLEELLHLLGTAPLIASVQASEHSPVADLETLAKLARASLAEGVRVLRLEGAETIRHIKQKTGSPAIGLIKRTYPGSDVYITPTATEVDALIDTGCEIIAFDGTVRQRPNGQNLVNLIQRIHQSGRLAMADCDTVSSAQESIAAGADIVGTTLSGYTADSTKAARPDLNLLRALVGLTDAVPVLAEGRYVEPWQVRMALRAGAIGVVLGGALNDPVKQTRRFFAGAKIPREPAGAIDIGGTWLRAGIISPQGEVLQHERISLPRTRGDRNRWINSWIAANGVRQVGIGAGGIISPETGEVLYSKPIIPDHVGTNFKQEIEAEEVFALNDGHATAWAHGLHREMAGQRVATLALGTGVGFGLVDRGRIFMGPRGEHARINDTPTRGGGIFDDLLGGAAVTATPSPSQIAQAQEAAEDAIRLIHTLFYPDVIVLAGGVGLQPWMDIPRLQAAAPGTQVRKTPYGPDAGLVGAGFLALYPNAWE